MIPTNITVTFPQDFRDWGNSPKRFNKIEAIKSIRSLTGWGLKESKDASESIEPVQLPIRHMTEDQFNTEIEILKRNGIEGTTIGTSHRNTFRTNMEEMVIQSIRHGEYNLAIDILEFIKMKL